MTLLTRTAPASIPTSSTSTPNGASDAPSPRASAPRPEAVWKAKGSAKAAGVIPSKVTPPPEAPTEAQAVQTALRDGVQAALTSDPALMKQQIAVQLLTSRRDELLAAARGMKTSQDAWLKEKGGFTSVGRLLAGVVIGVQEGSLAKVKEVATDATLGADVPYQRALGESTRTATLLQDLASQVAQGKDISSQKGKDATVDEAIALLTGAESTVESVAQNRLEYLRKNLQAKDVASATQDYRRVLQAYLGATSGGEGVGVKAGRPTVAGVVNALVASGALGDAGLIALPGEAVGLADAVSKVQSAYAKAPEKFLKEHPEAKEAIAALMEALGGRDVKKALAEEDARLAVLVAKPELRGVAAVATEAQKSWKALQQELEPGFLQTSWHVVRDAIDDPATLAMMAVTGGSGALVRAGFTAAGAAVVTAADVGMMARAGTLSGRALGMWSAATTAEAGLFHVGMNGFNIARGKDELAKWSAADFASSALLFHTLGGVTANAMKRVAPTTVLGKEGFQARLMAEQAGAMTLFSLGEAKLRNGEDASAMELLQHNLGFLVSMRMLGTAKGAFRRTPEATQQQLFKLESEVGRLATQYELNPTPENAARAYDVYRKYSELLTKTQQRYVEQGVTEKQQQLVKTKVRDVSGEEFTRIVDTWKDSALTEARQEARRSPTEDATYAEKAQAIEARHQTLRDGSVAFYDPLTGQTLVNRESNTATRDAVLRHEFSHQVFNSLPEAQRTELVQSLRAKGVEVKDPAALDELLAQWNGREVKAPVAPALKSLHDALTAVDGKTQKPLVDAYELDLGALDTTALQQLLSGKPVQTTSGARAPLPWGVPEIEGLSASSRGYFGGVEFFVQKARELGVTKSKNANDTVDEVSRVLFAQGDPLSATRATLLADGFSADNILGTFARKTGKSLNPGNMTPEMLKERLVHLPFASASPEIRQVYVDAINRQFATRSDGIKNRLRKDQASDKVFPAIFIGAGLHTTAAVLEAARVDPLVRPLVIEEGGVVSQFSETGRGFQVNSAGYQDKGQLAKPSSGEGDLNPTNGPILVTDLTGNKKYATGKDMGDAATINLHIASPGVVLQSRVTSVRAKSATPGSQEWPADWRVTFETTNRDGKVETLEAFTDAPVFATGISRASFARFDATSQELAVAETVRAQASPQDIGSLASLTKAQRLERFKAIAEPLIDVATLRPGVLEKAADSLLLDGTGIDGRVRKQVQTSQGYMASIGRDADPNEFARGKTTLVVGAGDSGFITAEALKGGLGTTEWSSDTRGRRQDGDVGPVLLAGGRGFVNSGDELRARIAGDGELRIRYSDLGGLARGRQNDLEPTASDVVGFRRRDDGRIEVYLANDFADANAGRLAPAPAAEPVAAKPRRSVQSVEDLPEAERSIEVAVDGSRFLITAESDVRARIRNLNTDSVSSFTWRDSPFGDSKTTRQVRSALNLAVRKAQLLALGKSFPRFDDVPINLRTIPTQGDAVILSGRSRATGIRPSDSLLDGLDPIDRAFAEGVQQFIETELVVPAPRPPAPTSNENSALVLFQRTDKGKDTYVQPRTLVRLDDGRVVEARAVDNVIFAGGLSTGTGQLLNASLPTTYDRATPLEKWDGLKFIEGPTRLRPEGIRLGKSYTTFGGETVRFIGPAAGSDLVSAENLANVKENSASAFNLIEPSGAVGGIVANAYVPRPYRTFGELVPSTVEAQSGALGKASLNFPADTAFDRATHRPLKGDEILRLKADFASLLTRLREVNVGNVELRFTKSTPRGPEGESNLNLQISGVADATAESLLRLLQRESPQTVQRIRNAVGLPGSQVIVRADVAQGSVDARTIEVSSRIR